VEENDAVAMVRAPRKTVRRPVAPKTTNLMNEVVELAAGKERHLRFRLKEEDVLTVTCKAKTKFYVALLRRPDYAKRVGAAGEDTFAFEFGSDVRGFSDQVKGAIEDDYYLVLRDGVFSPRVFVTVNVDLRRRGRVEPNIHSG
jgi:hypothetical protein